MYTHEDMPFLGYRNKAIRVEAHPEIDLGYEHDSTLCSCNDSFLQEFPDFPRTENCLRHPGLFPQGIAQQEPSLLQFPDASYLRPEIDFVDPAINLDEKEFQDLLSTKSSMP